MKHFIISFLLLILLAGCKKDKASPQTIIGKWELRHILGVQVKGAPSVFVPGNGRIIEFTDTDYKSIEDGKVTNTQTYTVRDASVEFDGQTFNKAIILGTQPTKLYFKLIGDKLVTSIGPTAADGATVTYQRL